MSNIVLVIPREVVGRSPKDKIVITGEFDNWQHSDYVLQYDEIQGYKVEIPRLNGKEKAMFKLLVNDCDWVTLSYFETITDNCGHTNNVLNYHDYELNDNLDDITISSVQDDLRQQEQLLNYTRNDYEEKEGEPKEVAISVSGSHEQSIPDERTPSEEIDSTQAATNDYVNISSHGELSSTEDLDCDFSGDDDLEETIQYGSNIHFNPNQRPLNGLVSIVKRAKTYWNN
ncbi:hypothetical protein ZYGR_0N06850 [Zygosaccharomyces rouxii]|uniref:ZYRO0D16016p n=2 Tax=Zygosaccharomyces rouxii TaxID=4956 RepID=C5DWM4_ZYGRC|nr:uncharacterized protein ZYRO0D16016g [Zygosaccharomyces rouxii]KAH9201104.1 hypothetical protein LQ764DRAFT_103445 [Zygosaccharomyces rouxii]GAV49278.1 hypothetical protein ZYGR_0N06850 [Zygosaccharomyces rouxii]CAR28193.1 ZYRO0D16016p [Zygosaccharomyces rouxii]